jgi:hypothetical protein
MICSVTACAAPALKIRSVAMLDLITTANSRLRRPRGY